WERPCSSMRALRLSTRLAYVSAGITGKSWLTTGSAHGISTTSTSLNFRRSLILNSSLNTDLEADGRKTARSFKTVQKTVKTKWSGNTAPQSDESSLTTNVLLTTTAT